MVCSFLVAWRLFYLQLERGGERSELAEPIIFWCAVCGIVGARVTYVLSFPQAFLADPLGAVFSTGGFVFYGGLIGAIIGVYNYSLIRKFNFLAYADYAAAPLSLGYAVGRIGCQLSGDGDYGIATNLPWAMSYVLGVVPSAPGVLVHPTPVYETLGALFICVAILCVRNRGKLLGVGQSFGLYLLLSATARFFVETLRQEPIIAWNLTEAQITSLVLAPIGLLLIFRKRSVK